MLVLTRRVDEQIVITAGADTIVITVTEIEGGKVKLGFEAPHWVKINRREIQDALPRLPERSDAMREPG